MVNDESIDSSNIYKSKREVMAIWTKITAGTIVQMHSIICLSNIFFINKWAKYYSYYNISYEPNNKN